MSDVIKTDYALGIECRNSARDIFEECIREQGFADEPHKFDPAQYRDEMNDAAHERADGSEHVIYTHRALQICANCDTTMGEEFVDDVGIGDNPTFESIATLIAYGQMRGMIQDHLDTLTEEWRTDGVTEYNILQHFLPALINGDFSGLTEREEKELLDFIHTESDDIQQANCWTTIGTDDSADGFFGTCEVSGAKGTVETVRLVNVEAQRENAELLKWEKEPIVTPERVALNLVFDLRRAICDLDGYTPRDAELLLAGPLHRIQEITHEKESA